MSLWDRLGLGIHFSHVVTTSCLFSFVPGFLDSTLGWTFSFPFLKSILFETHGVK